MAVIQRMLASGERSQAKLLRKELRRTYRAAANGFEAGGIEGVQVATMEHTDRIHRTLIAHHSKLSKRFARLTLGSLEKSVRGYAVKAGEFDIFLQLLEMFLRSQALLNVANDISETSIEQIRNVISRGIEEGLGVDEISRNIRTDLGNVMSRIRAATIARTETHNAAMWGQDQSARQLSIAPELQREWMAVKDSRTRGAKTKDDHFRADGQVRGMDEDFEFVRENGSHYTLRRPGDPEGPANGVVNCRCALGFVAPEA